MLVEGTAQSPQVVARHIVELSDPHLPAAKQPYHASTGLARKLDSPELHRLVADIHAYARKSVAELLDRVASSDRRLSGAGIAVGSEIDPVRIGNPHVRAHANEGRLFRTVVQGALSDRSIPSSTFVERELSSLATQRLGQSEEVLKRRLIELGRPLGGSWRRDDKMAVLAAWLVLASS